MMVSCEVLVVFLPDERFERCDSAECGFVYFLAFSVHSRREIVSKRRISVYSPRERKSDLRKAPWSKESRPRLSLFHFMYKGIARCRDQRNRGANTPLLI